jgi:hypothetical protein
MAEQQVFFKLQSGVTAHRLNSIKSALLMIELVKESQKRVDKVEQFKRFDNFVNYIFAHFSEPIAMALVKYAIADRKLLIKNLAESSSWARISTMFKPIMLNDSKDPKEKAKYARFERIHKKLKVMKPLSDMMRDFVSCDIQEIEAAI